MTAPADWRISWHLACFASDSIRQTRPSLMWVDRIRRTETWFSHNGLPQFVSDYNSREHIWTRALPALVFIMALQLISAVWYAVSNGSRVVPVVALAFAGFILLGQGLISKRRRGYWFAPADRVGWPVLVAFLACGIVSEMVQLGNEVEGETVTWASVLAAFALQAFLLAFIYILTRFAVLSMIGWGIRQTIRSASDLYIVATKALPLLLIVMIVLFINTEMWQVAGSLDGPVLWASAGMLLLLGVLVTLERTHEQILTLDQDAPVEQLRRSCQGTPLADAAFDTAPPPDLRRPQRRNLMIAAIFTQVVQAALIGFLIWLFFMVFGMVAISLPVQEAWMGDLGSVDVWWTFADDHVLSRALVRVSTFLGAFAAFYVTIYASSDPVFRASFSEDIGASLQQAVDVRRVYLGMRDA